MDKNTIWAIVLSTIVLIGFMTFQIMFFPSKPAHEAVASENSKETSAASTGIQSESAEKKDLTEVFEESNELEPSKESTYTITTKKARITLTNRGGDIVGYELLDHFDRDTGKGVEMADNISANDRFCALALGGTDKKIINDIFKVKKIDDYTIGFYKNFLVKNNDGQTSSFILAKEYSFKPDDYAFKLNIAISGGKDLDKIDFQNTAYTIRTAPEIGPHFDRSINRYESRQFISYDGEKAKKITLGSKQFKEYEKNFTWAGIAGKYFVEIFIPEKPETIKKSYYSTLVEANNYDNAQALFVRNPSGTTSINDTYYVYVGPRNERDLKIYNAPNLNAWGLSKVNLTESMQTSGFLSWIEIVLKWMMEIIYKVIPNWGISIIILTALLKIIMFPMTKKTSLGTLKMQEIQPKMTAIQEKYKDNQQKLQEETAKLYKETGYNPVSGCLPMLLQFVILFAMYNLFNNYFEFRGASFIPGWIPDLSAGDSIYTFKFMIPFLGNQLRLLPIIYLASQLLFGKITNNGGTTAGSSKMQMQIMMYGMPIFFFFLFYNAPSGLLLYWTVSNVIQMAQQLVINRVMEQKRIEMKLVSAKTERKYPPKKRK